MKTIDATRRARSLRRVLPAALILTAVVTSCGDDDDGPVDPAPGTTMPFVDGSQAPLDSTGGPGDTVLNNQPTSPAANNAPPGDDGTG